MPQGNAPYYQLAPSIALFRDLRLPPEVKNYGQSVALDCTDYDRIGSLLSRGSGFTAEHGYWGPA